MRQNADVSAFVPPFVDLTSVTSVEKYNTISTYAMKAMTADELREIANISEGMENRISQASFTNMDEYLSLTSKRYTRSTIKRIAACATIGLKKNSSLLQKTKTVLHRACVQTVKEKSVVRASCIVGRIFLLQTQRLRKVVPRQTAYRP